METNPLHTIVAFTENSPGVLLRLTTMFTRRKINIESLTVSETEQPGISRFTICIRADRDLVRKIVGQIRRIIEVRDAYASDDADLLIREVAMIRVKTTEPAQRSEIEQLALRHQAQFASVDEMTVVVEKTGNEEEVRSLYLMLEPYGITEFVRSGRIALRKVAGE